MNQVFSKNVKASLLSTAICLLAVTGVVAQQKGSSLAKDGSSSMVPTVAQMRLANIEDTLPEKKQLAVAPQQDAALYDTAFMDYDEIFSELDALLDSLYTPRSFVVINGGITKGYFSYSSPSDTTLHTKKQFVYSASVSFFDKSGLGLSGGATMIQENNLLNPFQFSVTGSYDYIQNRKFMTGIAYTRFFTKDSLSFYTSPLQNELFAYFTYRKSWLKPSVNVSYGWGNRSTFEEQETQTTVIRGKKIKLQTGTTQINSVEQLADLSVTASVRHDFFFLHPFGKKDYFRVTPQLGLISGTSQFGFNQSINSSPISKGVGQGQGLLSSDAFTAQNTSFENTMKFRPKSMMAFLKTEYVNRFFFLQPQVVVDYYLPATQNHFTTSFLINAGLIF